ncbi:141_t:CDS:1 [Funneliformis geosporum]|nr:141_t:CDS:1 [Funneliformis geosporum]
MSITKMLSGDLPELTQFVIKYLRYDLKSLYSCILVNRFLCRVTIPILWENPFALKWLNGKRFDFLEVYFKFFSIADIEFIEFETKIKVISNPLFNYPSFIKTLDTFRMESHAINWVNNLEPISSLSISNAESDKIFLDNEMKVLSIVNNDSKLKRLVDMICSFLLKSFIINNASLKVLNMKITTSHGLYLPHFFQLIFDNATFVSNVEKFGIGFIANPLVSKFPQLELLLTSLPSSLPSVKHFHISYISRSKNLTNETNSKIHLLKFNISLDAFNYYNNNLTSIEFYRCDFQNVYTFNELNGFTQLRFLGFIQCKWIKPQFFQPLLDTPTPLKLKSLKVYGQPTGFELLIEKAGSYLEHLDLFLKGASGGVYESIIIHCNRIKFLCLANLYHDDNSQLYKMIHRNNDHLKYLTLATGMNVKMNSKFLCGLGSVLSNSLEYLDLSIAADRKSLKTFLANFRNVGLKTFLFRNRKYENVDVTFNVLKSFVIENEIRNFSYNVNKYFNPEHHNLLQFIKNMPPSVNLQRYSDLVVSFSDFNYD